MEFFSYIFFFAFDFFNFGFYQFYFIQDLDFLLQFRFVITSYSIHYTKLYEYSGGVTEDRVRYSYSMVAGFQWRALDELNIYSSVIYSKVDSETYESRSKTEKREVEFYALTLGGDYGLTDDVAITFAVRNTIVSIKNRGLASNMKTSIDLNVATAALGIMKKY